MRALNISATEVIDSTPIQNLRELRALDISRCSITDIRFLSSFLRLLLLNCGYTKIAAIDDVVPFLKKGVNITMSGYAKENEFDFKDCPLVRPPIEIVKEGSNAILNYFQQLSKEEKEELFEAKVLLIGEGMSGKTSLRNRLLGRPLPNQPDRTKGLEVEVEPYKFVIDDGAELQLNLFDFGGQDHYKPLHQFFYSKRSLYILITKNGDDQNDFDFWLDTVQLHGKDSPLLIVNNLFGDVSCTFDKNKWIGVYPILKESLIIDLLRSEEITEVEKNIKAYAQTLPHIRQVVPKSWIKIRQKVQRLKSATPFISLEKFRSICRKEGIKEEVSILHLSQYLHDIGFFLHFQENVALKRWVILQYEWATDAVYRILDDPQVISQKGHFTKKDYSRIWAAKEYVDMQDALLALMTQFRLCYPKPNGKGYIAPAILPPTPVDFIWDFDSKERSLRLEYRFIPRVLFTQFLVSQHEKIADERLCVWRTGAIFERGKTRVLARQQGKNIIELRAQGSGMVDLLTVLNDALEDLHQQTPGLEVERKIPCICIYCQNSDTPHLFDKSRLDKRRDNGRLDDECQESFEKFLIDDLLGNILLPSSRFNKIDLDRKNQISQLIREGKPAEALAVFIAIPTLSKDVEIRLTMLLNRLNKNEREKNNGYVTYDSARTEENNIIQAVLELLADLT